MKEARVQYPAFVDPEKVGEDGKENKLTATIKELMKCNSYEIRHESFC